MNRREVITAMGGVAASMGVSSAGAEMSGAPPSVSNLTDPSLAQAWQHYYATLDECRAQIEASAQYRDVPQQRAKAFHALMEMQAQVYNFAVAPRLIHPRIFRNTGWQTEVYTLGGNGPDFDYRQIFLDGQQTYKLTGNMRDSRVVLGQLANGLPGSPGSAASTNYDFSDFTVGKDGSFEVALSAENHPGNWIKLDPASRFQWIQLRPAVETWDAVPAEFAIERISPIGPREYATEEFDPATVAQRINMGTEFARYMTSEWIIAFYQRVLKNSGGPNIFKPIGTQIAGQVGSPSAQYIFAPFELDDDEGLYIELPEAPNGTYWGFEILDVWLRSVDFRTRQTSLSTRQIQPDPDGKLRLVLSKRDPGIANWLDTGERMRGLTLLRNYRATKPANVTGKRIKLADLAHHIPANAKRVSADERQHILAQRQLGYLRRHGE